MRLRNKDIAERLGISTTAVSLALNGRPGVSEETRRRVFEVVNEDAARAFHDLDVGAGKRGTVILCVHKGTGLIIDDKPFFSSLVESVQQEAMREGYLVSLVHYVPGQDMEAHLAYLRGIGAVGMVLEATELTVEELRRYRELGMPLVLMDGYFDLEPVDAVTLDDMTAVFRAVHYAWDRGHRSVGFLAGTADIQNFRHHRDGYFKAVRELSMGEREAPLVEVGNTIDEAYASVRGFLAAPPEGFVMPTCWVAQMDYLALGAMRALKEAGWRVPEDVSMIGYDDLSLAAVSDPPLTTTRINRGDCGRLAMEALVRRIHAPERELHTVTTVSSRIVERESVRDLRVGGGDENARTNVQPRDARSDE